MSEELMPFNLSEIQSAIIKVLGVGGGGCNAVNFMYSQGIKDVDFLVTNTDAQALEHSPVPMRIQLGTTLTEGRGAGNLPEKGKQSAIETIDDIKKILSQNTKMIFITAGMGGGTGTGAAPVIAKAAKEMGILTVAIVTIPFRFEGQRRIRQAYDGIKELKNNVDSLLVINNEKLREIYGDLKVSDAFSHADNVLTVAAKGIAEIITVHGHLNVDFADVQTVMRDSGVALMGSATASGENRAIDAIRQALSSPLLNSNDIYGAKNILLNISSGSEEASMDEIGQINEYVQEAAGYGADLIWGNTFDAKLGDKIGVTVIATGFKTDIFPEMGDEKEKKKTSVRLQDRDDRIENKNGIFVLDGEDDDIMNNARTRVFDIKQERTEKKVERFELEEDIFNSPDYDSNERSENVKKQQERDKKYHLNYTENIDEWESIPAYKRKNVNVDNQNYSDSVKTSKYALSEDEEKKLKIRNENPYLHDRVD